eukprot:PRCOL_00005124-RA
MDPNAINQKSCRAPHGVAAVAAHKASVPTTVNFEVRVEGLTFGQFVCVVGSGETLGDWQPHKGVPLDYVEGEGNLWKGSAVFPSYELAEYKYVIRSGWAPSAECWWQDGPNNVLATNASQEIAVVDHWERHQWGRSHEENMVKDVYVEASGAAVEAFVTWEPPPPPPPPPEPVSESESESEEELSGSDADAALATAEGDAADEPAKKKKKKPAKKKPAVAVVEEPKVPPPPPLTKRESAEVPEWALEGTIYQIYPLGFFDAEPTNDHTGPVQPRLAKIREYYDYFEALGVTILQFSPLFESDTHGYDTADYFQIDRRLGDVALMKEIVAELKERGIRVVLDGVFNHTGPSHKAFLGLQRNGVHSEYAGWYRLAARRNELPGWCESAEGCFAYDCWEGHAMLPELDVTNHDVKQHIFDVARFWLCEVGVAGWRLDVAYEVSAEFWSEFRNVCKEAKHDCWLVGEIIHENYNTIVGDGMLGSATNYQLSKAMWSSLNDLNYGELTWSMQREQALYSHLPLLNFVGNHDVARIASQLHQPQHYLHATAFLLLARGVPSIYYGDELGMEGRPGEGSCEFCGGDDAMRRPMPDVSHLVPPLQALSRTDGAASAGLLARQLPWSVRVTKELIKLRETYPELFVHGELDSNVIDHTGTRMALVRSNGNARVVIAFNSGHEAEHEWRLEGVKELLRPDTTFVECLTVPAYYSGSAEPTTPGGGAAGMSAAERMAAAAKRATNARKGVDTDAYNVKACGGGVLTINVPALSVRVLIDSESIKKPEPPAPAQTTAAAPPPQTAAAAPLTPQPAAAVNLPISSQQPEGTPKPQSQPSLPASQRAYEW